MIVKIWCSKNWASWDRKILIRYTIYDICYNKGMAGKVVHPGFGFRFGLGQVRSGWVYGLLHYDTPLSLFDSLGFESGHSGYITRLYPCLVLCSVVCRRTLLYNSYFEPRGLCVSEQFRLIVCSHFTVFSRSVGEYKNLFSWFC